MTNRSDRGHWQRVLEARKQAREARGGDLTDGDTHGPPKAKTPLKAPELPRIGYGPGVRVLSLGEAAQRLGVSRAELEKMIDAGKIEAPPTGYTRMIPTSEVERLRS